ncbi:sensor histidine kinase [Neptunitalea lumnitzerae]|uniref:Signal transduction histidine kinase internal region domain-containing protein n=1 Tax=Neptunitalea lumnitzerae TaxID=2965509 RepID=A0ABQ5MI92_9FLAO|nr:histidine kinase [Neptunitalea sp. Y10]GLB49146.1 hypothetical protein Y10_15140 [Neptunitalea sp. Y10]
MIQFSGKVTKLLKLLFHIGFLGIIGTQLLMRVFDTLPDNWLFLFTSDAFENFICVSIVYVLYYVIFRFDNLAKRIAYTVFLILPLIGVAILKDYRIHGAITINYAFGYFTSLLGQALLFYLLLYFINRLDALNKYKKMEKELIETKELLMRNQLHPHFLFNAFNSLYSLSLKKKDEVPENILKLAGMMRYITDDIQLDKVPLKKEIDFIEKYIAIEKIRFGEEASITFTIENTLTSDILIAPFLLIPLVENAFKHGFYTNAKEAYVHMSLNITGNQLLFLVTNSVFKKQHFQESNREGKGLTNLKQRLQTLYPNQFSLHSNSTANSYQAQLKIEI